jgi:AcrR family transcriptional regulator
MTQPAASKRKYSSARRQAQAGETRRQIIEAARGLFVEKGYTGATIEAIAQRAGVAPETVFAVFGSKKNILAALIDLSVGGDEQPIPLMQRPGPQAVLWEQDPFRQLNLFAQDISTILERVAPIFMIMRAAAKTEPEIDGLLKKMLQQRLHNLTVFVSTLSAHSPLRPGLSAEQAAETVWAITSPDLFSLLTVDHGWSLEQFRQWLADALIRLLLP